MVREGGDEYRPEQVAPRREVWRARPSKNILYWEVWRARPSKNILLLLGFASKAGKTEQQKRHLDNRNFANDSEERFFPAACGAPPARGAHRLSARGAANPADLWAVLSPRAAIARTNTDRCRI